ncbi:MAG: hypothetical protein HETSPECPRED_000560 [Heterodermia speciosa]|uniref:DUF7707 domain-containing protein n=1 Tax=Heterodermia speciosa TaxID=116794 RepID=A0A8H3IZS7_9LECA|nr:MAG: hypothetical protein HETSPECPRED_000560 [Heterodermia speciosa]
MQSFIALAVVVATLFKLVPSQSIDPDSVAIATRNEWCTKQKASCPLLCLQIPGATAGTEANSCDADSLAFECVCSNGQSPNASQYSQTIPYFECTEFNTQCANNCGASNSACVAACRDTHPCGAQNPTRVNTSTISTMAATATGSSAAETSGSAAYTGFGSSSTASSSSDDSNAAQVLVIGFGRMYGTALVLSVVFGGFLML